MQTNNLSAHQLSEFLNSKKVALNDVAKDTIAAVKKSDKEINAVVFLNQQGIQQRCKDLSGIGSKGSLFGIPVLIKDNICVKDEPTTCASRILKDFRPPYNASVIEKLLAEGAILTGKANMDEFAFGSSCETSCYEPTRNPWNKQRIPGGSSGGSAAAVAAGETVMALGSDTGGSIRQPAALCGVVGMKPTYGRVSRYGLIAFASSLDQIGPITKDVTDCALLLNVIAGYDPKDSTSADVELPDYTKALVNDVKGIKIGVPGEYFGEGIDPQVRQASEEALNVLKNLGAKVEEISLPHTPYVVSTYYIIATAEASSNLARFDGVQYGLRESLAERENMLLNMYKTTRAAGFGSEAKRRIILGTYVLSSGYYDAYYLRAQKVRTLIRRDFESAFKKYDCIITPTTPAAAFKIGEKINDPLAMYLSDIFTISANLAGIPGISVPCGFTKESLPIGLQILGKAFDEETLIRVAYTYEQNTDWHKQRAKI